MLTEDRWREFQRLVKEGPDGKWAGDKANEARLKRFLAEHPHLSAVEAMLLLAKQKKLLKSGALDAAIERAKSKRR